MVMLSQAMQRQVLNSIQFKATDAARRTTPTRTAMEKNADTQIAKILVCTISMITTESTKCK